MGCATYSEDLRRATRHYDEQHFPRALAMLRLLGEDVDALSPSDQVRYAYLRGMTDVRLADLVAGADAAKRPALQVCARFYLSLALDTPNAREALTGDELARASAALEALKAAGVAHGPC